MSSWPCLDRCTPETLGDEIRREYAGAVQLHTRGSILQRLFSRRVPLRELSQTLGINGLPQIDLWRPE